MSPAVLVVDDEPGHRKLVARFLTSRGCAVRSAADGGAALAEVWRDPPDAIVTDVLMPGLDGIALVGALRRHGWHGPVVLVSAAPVFDDLPQGVTFIPKPFDLTLLAQAVAEAVAGGRRAAAVDAASPSPRPSAPDRRAAAWQRPVPVGDDRPPHPLVPLLRRLRLDRRPA